MADFDKRTALVTGAGSGIGQAVALGLAAEGAAVVVQDLNLDAAQAVVDDIVASGGQAVAASGDVSQPADIRSAVETALDHYGHLHLAVNNAGISGPLGTIGEYDDSDDFEAYRRLIGINMDSVFYGMRYEIPVMVAAGGGAIVNMSSILGLVGNPNAGPYVTAKHGVAGMTKSAGVAYAAQGVRINSVHPGYIDTPLLSHMSPDAYDALVKRHPVGRLGTAQEVSNLVLFLLSDKATFINGAQYVIDGGYTAV